MPFDITKVDHKATLSTMELPLQAKLWCHPDWIVGLLLA